MVVGENKRTNIMDGIENTGDVRLHDHRLRLKQRFDIVRKLGQGTYGKVQLGINKKTGQEVAIKTIKKCKIESEADLIRIRREVQIMSSVRHPNIVHIYEVFENSEKMILVMEYCSGGELYDYLSQKKVLQEDEARRLFRQIATAVYYCHIHKICHRDLKLENVLLDDTGSAKIADFGLSNVFKETSLLSTFCGSPLYASPEIVKGTPYIGPEVDCWSLGVLLYTLVYGAMPFDGSNFKRLVRQISNGDYYEPKAPSSASPLIRDMLTVDPLKRADIAYICDHPWVNTGCQISCLEMSEALAAETPVRLDLLLSLAPAAPSNCNSVLVPESELGPEESGTDLTSSASMAVEPSNSAEKRILELVAEGGEDAIKPSPTRTIVAAGDNKRKLDVAMSSSGLQRKKERVASCASISPQPAVPEENATEPGAHDQAAATEPRSLKSSATITIQPAAAELVKDLTKDLVKEPEPAPAPKEEELKEKPTKTRVAVKKKVTAKLDEKTSLDKQEEAKAEEAMPNSVSTAADKLTSLSLTQQTPPSPPAAAAPATPPSSTPAPAPAPVTKPKKLSIPGGNVGNFKDQFERRASLTSPPEPKRTVTKPVLSKIAKPKAQSEDRELPSKEPGTVRLQQIGIEPSPTKPSDEAVAPRGGVKKTESEPSHSSAPMDPSALLQDARRSLQNSMAKLAEEKAGEEGRKRARDIISTYIRAGKPPVPYGRSSSAGVTSLLSPPQTPPAAAPAPVGAATSQASAPRVFRTEAQHRIEDHRPRGVSVERIIPIHVSESPPSQPPPPAPKPAPAPASAPRQEHTPVRRLVSSESNASESCSSPGEPIKKSAREFIIPIAVEGKGYVTPRQRSLEREAGGRPARTVKPRRISSLVSGGESEEEDDTHMHRLRSTRAARAESVSSGEEDEEDEGFHLLTAENLFSTLLHRVRALTNRLNGEEGPGFQHPHSLFNNLQSPFFNSPHLPRRNLLREGWGRDRDFDSMFSSRQPLPRGNSKKSGKHQTRPQQNAESNSESGTEGGAGSALDLSSIQLSEAELRALSGLTPALARRLQRQLLAHLPPAAARQLRRTLSLTERSADTARADDASHSVPATPDTDRADPPPIVDSSTPKPDEPQPEPATYESPTSYCTLPRLRKPAGPASPPSERSSLRSTPERPLLSKYLPAAERALSLDDSCSSESNSLLSEPSYLAAYPRPRPPPAADSPRKRISRFLRPDFFDSPPDENVYIKHKKEKELETQKILREIREKKNRSLESSPTVKYSAESDPPYTFKDDGTFSRKCLSPVAILTAKERSRSNTPFFPSLDNIKETAIDSSLTRDTKPYKEFSELKQKSQFNESSFAPDSRLTRPKSYPIKNLDSIEEPTQNLLSDTSASKETESKENNLQRESKLIRPKSYPASSPSPEKVYISRNIKKDEAPEKLPPPAKINTPSPEVKNDVEVSFSITLPKKKVQKLTIANSLKNSETLGKTGDGDPKLSSINESLDLKKYKVINSNNTSELKDHTKENGTSVVDGGGEKNSTEETSIKNNNITSKKEDVKIKSTDSEAPSEKKGTIKKKIIKKVSSKPKTDVGNSQDTGETKTATEKKKVTKKVKEKSSEDGTKPTVTKKKSVLQSIGHKLEKFASNKSASPEKVADNNIAAGETKKDSGKQSRAAREHSVPAAAEPPTESNLIKRAVTLTDVAALENQNTNLGKTTVSKVLGLFKKFEPKEKATKPLVEKSHSENHESSTDIINKNENATEEDNSESLDVDKPKRPTSLLLNGLGRKKYGKTTSDSVMTTAVDDETTSNKKENEPKNLKNTLKLDFSRLPRVKKIVPTNPVIEPQYINTSLDEKETEKKVKPEKNGTVPDGNTVVNNSDTLSRSRSRSRSTTSNSENKSDLSIDYKTHDANPTSPLENIVHHPLRNHESLSPEKEDIVDRIRRKSFYSRFNEKKQRRKSNLVGPGAAEYDPLARIHSPPADPKPDISPAAPPACDLSPGYSVGSDLSPSTERYRSLLTDLPVNTRSHLRFDSYGLNDKVDTYRSLDRSELRKYPGSRSYLDYAEPAPASLGAHRYSRTKSLLDDGEDSLRDPHRYNRTISMYSPGNYATYRPKRTRNSAIILKESEKEPSPENILDKIRQRKKISISVTRKPDLEKDPLPRSTISPKGEGDGAECSEKVD